LWEAQQRTSVFSWWAIVRTLFRVARWEKYPVFVGGTCRWERVRVERVDKGEV